MLFDASADYRVILITFPDLPGCMADGETEAEAVENGRDAFLAVVSALADMGRDIPCVEKRPAFAGDMWFSVMTMLLAEAHS